MNTKQVNWQEVICPECGRKFFYPKEGYKPSTCGNYECVRNFLHPMLKRRTS